MSFGIPDLLDGVEVTTLAVAMFAIGETLFIVAQGNSGDEKVEAVKGSVWMSAQDWARLEALAARHVDRFPHRRDAGGRC